MNNTDDLYDDLQTEIRELQEQNEKLEAWIDDLQSGMYINCVYCGHRYGPNTPRVETTMRKALEEHIASCPKHPLSKAKSELEQARRELADLRGRMEESCVSVAGVYMDRSIADFRRACSVLIAEEQMKPLPNNALVAVLCDSIRLSRELTLKAAAKDADNEPK